MPFSTWRLSRKVFSVLGVDCGQLPSLEAFCFWQWIKVKSVKTKIWPQVYHKYYITARKKEEQNLLTWFTCDSGVFIIKRTIFLWVLLVLSDTGGIWVLMKHEIWSHHRGSAGFKGNHFTNWTCPIHVISLQVLHSKQLFISDDMKGMSTGKSLCKAHS